MSDMPGNQPDNDPGEQPDASEVGKAFVHLFEAFCTAHDVSANRRAAVNPSFFFKWLRETHTVSAVELSSTLGITELSAMAVVDAINDPSGLYRIQGTWPYICLAGRSNPSKPLARFQFILNLTWEDGTVVPTIVQGDQGSIEPTINDAIVASELTRRVPVLVMGMLENGLDRIYDEHQKAGVPRYGRHSVVQNMAKLVTHAAGVTDADKAEMMCMLNLLANLFPSPMPRPGKPITNPVDVGSGPVGGFEIE